MVLCPGDDDDDDGGGGGTRTCKKCSWSLHSWCRRTNPAGCCCCGRCWRRCFCCCRCRNAAVAVAAPARIPVLPRGLAGTTGRDCGVSKPLSWHCTEQMKQSASRQTAGNSEDSPSTLDSKSVTVSFRCAVRYTAPGDDDDDDDDKTRAANAVGDDDDDDNDDDGPAPPPAAIKWGSRGPNSTAPWMAGALPSRPILDSSPRRLPAVAVAVAAAESASSLFPFPFQDDAKW